MGAASGEYRLIICIMPAGRGREALNRLRQTFRIIDVAFHHARGAGTRRNRRGRLLYDERDVAQVLVAAADADTVFEFLYREAGLAEPHTGMLLMTAAGRAQPMLPPAGFVEY